MTKTIIYNDGINETITAMNIPILWESNFKHKYFKYITESYLQQFVLLHS